MYNSFDLFVGKKIAPPRGIYQDFFARHCRNQLRVEGYRLYGLSWDCPRHSQHLTFTMINLSGTIQPSALPRSQADHVLAANTINTSVQVYVDLLVQQQAFVTAHLTHLTIDYQSGEECGSNSSWDHFDVIVCRVSQFPSLQVLNCSFEWNTDGSNVPPSDRVIATLTCLAERCGSTLVEMHCLIPPLQINQEKLLHMLSGFTRLRELGIYIETTLESPEQIKTYLEAMMQGKPSLKCISLFPSIDYRFGKLPTFRMETESNRLVFSEV